MSYLDCQKNMTVCKKKKKKGAFTVFSTLKRRFHWYPTSIIGTGK